MAKNNRNVPDRPLCVSVLRTMVWDILMLLLNRDANTFEIAVVLHALGMGRINWQRVSREKFARWIGAKELEKHMGLCAKLGIRVRLTANEVIVEHVPPLTDEDDKVKQRERSPTWTPNEKLVLGASRARRLCA